MSDTTTFETAAVAVLLPTAQIVPGNNDRTIFKQESIDELAASIAQDGLAQPITVRPIADGLFQIVAGERRWRSCKQLGWETVPAIVREMTDKEAARIMLAENLHRVDLDPMDEAGTYRKWMQTFGYDEKQVAKEAGVKLAQVRKRLALLELIADVQTLVRSGQLKVELAECMTGLNEYNQAQAIKALGSLARHPSVSDFRKICGELLEKQDQPGFDFGDFWSATVTEDGKRKVRRLPVDPTLPKMDMKAKNGWIGTCMADYAQQLKDAGLDREAAAIFSVTQHLVDLGRLWLEDKPEGVE